MPANKPKFKISYNCPVVLTYAAVCLVLVAVALKMLQSNRNF